MKFFFRKCLLIVVRLFLQLLLSCTFTSYLLASDESSKVNTQNLVQNSVFSACDENLVQIETLDAYKKNEIIERFKEVMGKSIIGQDLAIDTLADSMARMLSDLFDPKKPMGRYLLVGPTGVGKTRLVQAFVEYLKGDADYHLIRLDMGEFQGGHEISRLTGATPNYAGGDVQPQLHPEALKVRVVIMEKRSGKKMELNIVLFDEIEKGHENVQNLMLGVLDNGKVTMGDNTEGYLRKSVVFATSNQGAKEVEVVIDTWKRYLKIAEDQIEQNRLVDEINDKESEGSSHKDLRGQIFAAFAQDLKKKLDDDFFLNLIEEWRDSLDDNQLTDGAVLEEEKDLTGRSNPFFARLIRETYVWSLKKKFKPEWLNRFQAILQFLHLGPEQFLKISDIVFAGIQKRIFERVPEKFVIQVLPEVKQYMVDMGADFKNGARELETTVEKIFVTELANLLAAGEFSEGDGIIVGVKGEASERQLTWSKVAKGLSRDQVRELADKAYPGMGLLKTEFDVEDAEPLVDGSVLIQGILTQLGKSPKIINEIWEKIPQKPIVEVTGSGADQEVLNRKFLLIGNQVVRISATKKINAPTNSNEVTWHILHMRKGVPEGTTNTFSPDTLLKLSFEEVQEIIESALSATRLE